MPKVLIVDDETIFRRGIRHLIGGFDLDWSVVGEARDGLEALVEIERTHPDLVITDIRMPRKDGLELQSDLKAKYPRIRCIVLSGYSDFQYAQHSMRSGACDYLLKPINKEELYQTLFKLELELKRPDHREDKPAGLHGVAVEKHAVDKVVQYMLDHYAEPITLSLMAEKVYLNASYLSSQFKSRLGVSFVEKLTEIRIQTACHRLAKTEDKVIHIAEETGFVNIRHFNRVFKTVTGLTPKQYREGNNGEADIS